MISRIGVISLYFIFVLVRLAGFMCVTVCIKSEDFVRLKKQLASHLSLLVDLQLVYVSSLLV